MAFHRHDTVLWVAFLILLIVAPLPAGSISPLAQNVLAFGLYALLAVWFIRLPSPDVQLSSSAQGRFRLLMGCWLSASLFAVTQAAPLPHDMLADVSQSTARLYGWTVPADNPPHAWRSLSTTPAATIQSALWIGACGSAFFLAARFCSSRRRMIVLALTIVAVGAAEVVYALIQTKGSLQTSATGTYVNRNHFAALLTMAFALTLALLLVRSNADRPAEVGSTWHSFDQWARTSPLIVLALFLFAGIIFSFSRMGLIATLVVALLFFLSWPSVSRRKRIIIPTVGFGLIVLVLLAGAWPAFKVVMNRFQMIDASYRLAAWQGTIDLFRSSPFLGIGLGGLLDNLPRFLSMPIKEVFDHTHNEPLEILAEGGLFYASLFTIGLLLYCATVIGTRRRRHDAVARGLALGSLAAFMGVFLESLTEFPLRMPANALYLWVILGLGWAAVHHRNEQSASTWKPLPGYPMAFRTTVVLVSLAGMGFSSIAAAADLLDQAGERLVQKAEAVPAEARQSWLERASELHRRATAIEPWQPLHSFRLGRAYEAMAATQPPISEAAHDLWANAAHAYRRAVDLHPANARVQAAWAWAALQNGEPDASRRAAEAALKLNPHDASVRFTIAKWYLVQWEELDVENRRNAVQLIRTGTAEMPEAYIETIWQFIPDLDTIRRLLPEERPVREALLKKLTEQQLFVERWKEQETYPVLRPSLNGADVTVLSKGILKERHSLAIETNAGAPWSGLLNGWLSGGVTAVSQVQVAKGESVVLIPIKAEPAGGTWPIVAIAIGGKNVALPSLSEAGWHTAYLHLHTLGGTFPLKIAVINPAVVREKSGFVERRIGLDTVKALEPNAHSRYGYHGHFTEAFP